MDSNRYFPPVHITHTFERRSRAKKVRPREKEKLEKGPNSQSKIFSFPRGMTQGLPKTLDSNPLLSLPKGALGFPCDPIRKTT